MTVKDPKTFSVAIIGSGLGGLLLALFLQKNCPQIDIAIYESAHELSEIGAGIGVWPRIWEILRNLGLEEDLIDVRGTRDKIVHPTHILKGDEQEMFLIRDITPLLETFHRSDVQKVLVKHLHSADKILHFSKRLESYIEPASAAEPIVMTFTDGTTAMCDLLVGSDGIRSAVRRAMYAALANEAEGHQTDELRAVADPVWSGQVAYRSLIPSSKLPNDVLQAVNEPSIVCGRSKNLVWYPVSRGELINVVAIVETPGGEGITYEGPWVTSTTAEEVTAQFGAWDPKIQTLLRNMEDPKLWAINTLKPLPTYVKGRVALIGDAAHAMTPHQASGAGQAIEDGFILATVLAQSSVTLANLTTALQVYDTVRRPFSQGVQQGSKGNGMLYHLLRVGWEDVAEEQSTSGTYPRELLSKLGDAIEMETSWVGSATIMEDRERAIEMLEKLLV